MIVVRVLVIDDHPLVHEVMPALLERVMRPDEIFVHGDLLSALHRAAQGVDLVILDLGLPGYKGIDALSDFRRCFPDIPVVVYSAYDDEETIRAAIDAGANGYIPKHTKIDAIERALEKVAAGEIYAPPIDDRENETNLIDLESWRNQKCAGRN